VRGHAGMTPTSGRTAWPGRRQDAEPRREASSPAEPAVDQEQLGLTSPPHAGGVPGAIGVRRARLAIAGWPVRCRARRGQPDPARGPLRVTDDGAGAHPAADGGGSARRGRSRSPGVREGFDTTAAAASAPALGRGVPRNRGVISRNDRPRVPGGPVGVAVYWAAASADHVVRRQRDPATGRPHDLLAGRRRRPGAARPPSGPRSRRCGRTPTPRPPCGPLCQRGLNTVRPSAPGRRLRRTARRGLMLRLGEEVAVSAGRRSVAPTPPRVADARRRLRQADPRPLRPGAARAESEANPCGGARAAAGVTSRSAGLRRPAAPAGGRGLRAAGGRRRVTHLAGLPDARDAPP
jgi:hypothetical protein